VRFIYYTIPPTRAANITRRDARDASSTRRRTGCIPTSMRSPLCPEQQSSSSAPIGMAASWRTERGLRRSLAQCRIARELNAEADPGDVSAAAVARFRRQLVSLNKGCRPAVPQSFSVNPQDPKTSWAGRQDNKTALVRRPGPAPSGTWTSGVTAAVRLQRREPEPPLQPVHRPGERRELPGR
jgi:hypothetical protein